MLIKKQKQGAMHLIAGSVSALALIAAGLLATAEYSYAADDSAKETKSAEKKVKRHVVTVENGDNIKKEHIVISADGDESLVWFDDDHDGFEFFSDDGNIVIEGDGVKKQVFVKGPHKRGDAMFVGSCVSDKDGEEDRSNWNGLMSPVMAENKSSNLTRSSAWMATKQKTLKNGPKRYAPLSTGWKSKANAKKNAVRK